MNLISINKKFLKIAFMISIISFLWIGSLGLLYHMSPMNLDATQNGCLFGGASEPCAMTFSEHITLWQGIITILPQDTFGIIGALLVMVALAITFTFYRDYLFEFTQRIYSRYRLYIKQHPQINLFNYLKDIFSSGILNRKIYKIATI